MMWQGSARDLNVVPAYFGGDVAEKVITENRERFAEHHNKRFEVWDLTKCPVPQFRMKDAGELQSFQMVLTRDVIMHLRYDCLLLSILKLIGELTLFLVISFKLRERSQIHRLPGTIRSAPSGYGKGWRHGRTNSLLPSASLEFLIKALEL